MTQLNLIGCTLGQCEISAELGRGGMAVVYKARQVNLDRIVAIKVLPPELSYDTSYIARFQQEARSAARLEHPHIVPIYEIGAAPHPRGGDALLHYIVMKYIQGRTLKEVIRAEGALSLHHAVELLDQVGAALDYAHRQGVIHRDVKPSNIMVADEGWVYLADFGLARGTEASSGLTMTGTVMGTPEYMSPEQAQGLPSIGPPTDIYALGVVLYETLTGNLPFQADTPMAMLAARLLKTPRPPRDFRGDLPPPVEDVIMRSLARKPEARYHSAADLLTALRQAGGITARAVPLRPITPFAGTPVAPPTPPPTPPYVLPPVTAAPAAPAQLAAAPPAVAVPPALVRPERRRGGMLQGIFIGMALMILLLVLLCIGLYMLGSSIDEESRRTLTPLAAPVLAYIR